MEGLVIKKGAFEKLVENSNGDLRKSVNLLQIASQLFSQNITEEIVDQISGVSQSFSKKKIFLILKL